MIKYEKPAPNGVQTGNFKTFKVWGVIELFNTDPNLSSFHSFYTLKYYQTFGSPISGSGQVYNGTGYNLTGGGGRNSFRNHIASGLTNNTSTIGPITITTNTTLYYGAGSVPGLIRFEFLISGTCFRPIPNCFLTWSQIEDPNITFPNIIIPYNNNNWALIYED